MKRKSNDEFSFICGNESYNKVDVTVDQNCRASVKSITPTEKAEYSQIKAEVPSVSLPAVPGRRYLATPEASVALKDGGILAGTYNITKNELIIQLVFYAIPIFRPTV